MTDNWLPITEFAVRRGVSVSTLRRYIKSGKIKSKLSHGRYLILDDEDALNLQRFRRPEKGRDIKGKLKKLEAELRSAQQEIAELKMLVALYEEKIPEKSSL